MNKFSKNVYELRKKSGLTQEDLAERMEVSRQTISNWETGVAQPTLDKAIEISELFSVSIDELIGQQSKSKELHPSRVLTNLIGQTVTIRQKVSENKPILFDEIVLKNCLVKDVSPVMIKVILMKKKIKEEKMIFTKDIELIEKEN
ncbi:helix-turn-helix transcriptional regulator [Erysipelothrix urinaevulpis]|uniref:helix-turn-helix transcriptional regulator n=1 Tax=Erysipelothrix urinaevulpis TaxID=2683717 RepID=UPI00135BA17A|nr:helix-turn-helix transcriptional regulator [Erysipelothrix urinaevulpis]